VAEKLLGTLRSSRSGLPPRAGTSNLEAYELFLKGRALAVRRGSALGEAIECLERAVSIDPAFAEAHAWMAESYWAAALYGLRPPLEVFPLARLAAERALAVDATLSHPHHVLGLIQLAFDYDIPLSGRSWRRALELNPMNTQARANCALWWHGLARGDWTTADAELARAASEDPLNPLVHSLHAKVLSERGRLDDAIAVARHATEIDRDAYIAWWALLAAYGESGRLEDAIAAADVALGLSGRHPWALGELGLAYANAGHIAEAEAILQELISRRRVQHVSPMYTAFLSAALGHMDEAMELAKASIAGREPMAIAVTTWHQATPLRSHPAYPSVAGVFTANSAIG
jgi:tetratricopeptide (TPR) repeat protein